MTDAEMVPVTDEGFSDDEMLIRRLWKWEAEMSRSAREMQGVPGLTNAAYGTGEVARALRDAAVRITAIRSLKEGASIGSSRAASTFIRPRTRLTRPRK